MNYQGLFIVDANNMSGDARNRLMSFLFKSGFSILCNEASTMHLILAMKRMGGTGEWRLATLECLSDHLCVTLDFCPASFLADYRQRTGATQG